MNSKGWNVALVFTGDGDVIDNAFITSPEGDVEALPRKNADGSDVSLPSTMSRTLPACEVTFLDPPAPARVSVPGIVVLEEREVILAGGIDGSLGLSSIDQSP